MRFPHHRLREGEAIAIGQVRIEPLHTPGHTPEHLSFLVLDHARSARVPMLLLSGDFLFVGSLGRPDLLGEEAKRGARLPPLRQRPRPARRAARTGSRSIRPTAPGRCAAPA